jgi:hypothetical protein
MPHVGKEQDLKLNKALAAERKHKNAEFKRKSPKTPMSAYSIFYSEKVGVYGAGNSKRINREWDHVKTVPSEFHPYESKHLADKQRHVNETERAAAVVERSTSMSKKGKDQTSKSKSKESSCSGSSCCSSIVGSSSSSGGGSGGSGSGSGGSGGRGSGSGQVTRQGDVDADEGGAKWHFVVVQEPPVRTKRKRSNKPKPKPKPKQKQKQKQKQKRKAGAETEAVPTRISKRVKNGGKVNYNDDDDDEPDEDAGGEVKPTKCSTDDPEKGDRVELMNYDDSQEAMEDGDYWCSGKIMTVHLDGDVRWLCDDKKGTYEGSLGDLPAWNYLESGF